MLTRSIMVALCAPVLFGFVLPSSADVTRRSDGSARLVQIPYEALATEGSAGSRISRPCLRILCPFTPEELQRAEALLPLLEGKQEFWAMGEFVHLGEPVVPVVTKALTMPGPRIRYNAIETLSMLKSPTAAPALIETANKPIHCPVFANMPCESRFVSIPERPPARSKSWRKIPIQSFGNPRRSKPAMFGIRE